MKSSAKSVSIAVLILWIAASFGVIKEALRLSREPNVPILASSYSIPVPDLKAREIETKNRLWLNGYLGLFFNFGRVGYWSWLVLPLFLVFLAGLKKKRKWEIALACVYILSVVLIGTKGYFNYRYALTLIPFNVTFILAFGRDVFAGFHRMLRVGAYGFIALLIIFNIRQHNPTMFQVIPPPRVDSIPWGLLNKINAMNLKRDGAFLECNAPAFYYYTNKMGFSYEKRFLHNKPGILTEQGIDNIFQEEAGVKEPDPEKMARAFDIMKSRYNIKYIFINKLPNYFVELNELIRYGCDMLAAEKSYSLFKLKDHFIHPLLEVKKRSPVYQTDFSKWRGPATILSGDLDRTLPPLMVLGIRGEFNLTVSSNREDRVIRVTPVQKDKNGDMVIFLGCGPNHNGFDLKIQPGKDIVFRAVLNLSNTTKNPAKILVEDEIKGWEMEASDINKPGWNQYVVTRRIRDNANDILIGILWQPEKKTDSLEIKKLEIFII